MRYLFVSLLAFWGCDSEPLSQQVVHPNENLLLPPDAERIVWDVDLAVGPGSPRARIGVHISDTVGALSAPERFTFGTVTSGLVDRHRNLLLLDAQTQLIQAIGADGTSSVVASAGMGPGELAGAERLFEAGGTLLVLEARGEISRFDSGTSGYEFDGTTSVPYRLIDGCAIGEHLFLHGTPQNDGFLIHRHTLDGLHVLSFGKSYLTENAVIRDQLSRGTMACVATRDVVVFAASLLPIVTAYRPDGSILWSARLADFRAREIVERRNGSGMRRSEDGYHFINKLQWVEGSELILVQVTHVFPGEGPPYRLHTMLVDVNEGRLHAVDDSLPSIVGWGRDGPIMYESVPFPRVFVSDSLWIVS